RTLVHRSPARKHSRGSLMRTPTLLAVGMAGLWLGAGCSNPMGVIPPPSDRNFVLVDQFPAWTPDGAALYFHRGFASSLGPPGLYRTTWAGDTTTPVGVGDRTGPIKLRVSPDGSRIGALWYSGLISIDPLSRTFQTLYRTDNGEDSFDWDPAGNRVVV